MDVRFEPYGTAMTVRKGGIDKRYITVAGVGFGTARSHRYGPRIDVICANVPYDLRYMCQHAERGLNVPRTAGSLAGNWEVGLIVRYDAESPSPVYRRGVGTDDGGFVVTHPDDAFKTATAAMDTMVAEYVATPLFRTRHREIDLILTLFASEVAREEAENEADLARRTTTGMGVTLVRREFDDGRFRWSVPDTYGEAFDAIRMGNGYCVSINHTHSGISHFVVSVYRASGGYRFATVKEGGLPHSRTLRFPTAFEAVEFAIRDYLLALDRFREERNCREEAERRVKEDSRHRDAVQEIADRERDRDAYVARLVAEVD